MGKPVIVQVQVLEARSNPLYTDEQRALVRFLRYTAPVPCAECGTRSRHHWTMRVSFTAARLTPGTMTLVESGTVHLPLAPVCRAHPLAPAALPAAPKRARAQG